MISGKMYYLKNKDSVLNNIYILIKLYKINNFKYILVNRSQLNKEITVKNIRIKPVKGVIKNHYWFITEDNLEKDPNK